jgi:hypothetical protein
MRGPDHVWPRFGLRLHLRLTSSEVSLRCNKHPQYYRPLFVAFLELFTPNLQVFPMPDWVLLPKSTEIGLKPRNALLEVALTSRTYTAPWINRCGPRISTRHLHFLLLPRLHHSLPQFLQGILRPPPHDAVVPQGQKHRPQQRIDKQYGADRVQKKVIRRYRGTPRHAQINQEN